MSARKSVSNPWSVHNYDMEASRTTTVLGQRSTTDSGQMVQSKSEGWQIDLPNRRAWPISPVL